MQELVECMILKVRDYHQDGMVTENSLVSNSKDSIEGVGKMKE